MFKLRVKEGDRVRLEHFEVFVEKVGHRNVHLGIRAPRELTIVRQKNALPNLGEIDKVSESGRDP